MMDIVLDILTDSVKDTLYLVVFLFVTYLIMEWLEHKAGERAQESIRRAGAAGPVVGAILGVVPQCGFSAAAATLYAGRVITLGTLFAVFLSTSDEMLPIFLAEQVDPLVIGKILGAKIVIGMVMGFVVDAALRLAHRDNQKLRIHELCEEEHCECNHNCEECEAHPEKSYEHDQDEENHHNHEHDHEYIHIVKSALKHTVQVALFIFIITIVLNACLTLLGEDALAGVIGSNPIASVFVAGLVGLIPNCAASVVVAQLYVEGLLGAGAMMAGLLVSAGIGLLVLCRTNRKPAQNIAIIIGFYATGVFWGLLIQFLGITF